jgi:two-component system OmpR family response regulator
MKKASRHILIVDDDPELCDLVGKVISSDGYRVSRAENVRAAQRHLAGASIDLILLDIMLPGKDGLTFCRELRAESVNIPIIMLTAKGDDFDRVLGLEMGADDYLSKPFHSRELLARVKAVLRRSGTERERRQDAYLRFQKFDAWTLDTGKRELVSADGIIVSLSSAEFELLLAFVAFPQVILTREKLLDLTRGRSAIISDRSIDIQVSRLRRKLGDDPRSPRVIKTVWGDGYLFTPDVT